MINDLLGIMFNEKLSRLRFLTEDILIISVQFLELSVMALDVFGNGKIELCAFAKF